jgi:uncharacterized protein
VEPAARLSEEIVAALSDPATYAHRPEAVRHLQTHLSHVFVAPPYAFKLKKAIRFSFADFATAEARRRACEDEVRLNRRLCAPLYLGVLAVVRTPHGRIALEPLDAKPDPIPDRAPQPSPTALDAVVCMRALPEHGLLPHVLEDDRLPPATLREFARALAAFHATAETGAPIADCARPDALVRRWNAVLDDAQPMVGELLRADDRFVLGDFGPRFVARHASLLDARCAAGRVRELHGDLHAGNLCLIEEPLPPLEDAPAVAPGLYAFDCIEFSRELRANDVASEVAFLAMDLEARGRPDLARVFVDAYVGATEDADLRLLLPFYASHRAAIRGMVLGLAAREAEVSSEERAAAAARARLHFRLAARHAWRSGGRALIACAGLSGSGKSTLAEALAEATGFPLLSSDALRKERAGLDPRASAPRGARDQLYRREARRATYEALAAEAARLLAAGQPVIVDATFNREEDRTLLEHLAAAERCPLVFLDCRADDAAIRERLLRRAASNEARHRARSDADVEVYLAQKAERQELGPGEPAIRIDTTGPLDEVRSEALRALWRWRAAHPVSLPAARSA